MDFDLTPEEEKAIRALERLSKKWPESLWLYSANGTLCIMRKGDDGHKVFKGEGCDQDYVVTTIDIDSDGGDF